MTQPKHDSKEIDTKGINTKERSVNNINKNNGKPIMQFVIYIIMGGLLIMTSTIAVMEKSSFGKFKEQIGENSKRLQSLEIEYQGNIRSIMTNLQTMKELYTNLSGKLDRHMERE